MRRSAVPPCALLLACAILPCGARAHGAFTPNASSYLAKVGRTPAGVQARVVDGDLRLWLRVSPSVRLEVLDYTGVPYLRFSRAGVEVNKSSAIYYLNLTPVEVPPPRLGAKTPPRWQKVSDGHEYEWHDGRPSALTSTVLAPGATFVGKWSVAVRVDGHLASISGGIWHAPDPPVVWFWPAIVIFACVLAAFRLRRLRLDFELSRLLAVAVIAAMVIGTLGRQLQGRPSITAWQIGLLIPMLLVLFAALAWTLCGKPGCFFLFVVCVASLWEDFELIPALLHGYVLMAMPAFVIRFAAVVCLGAGAGLFLLVARMADLPEGTLRLRQSSRQEPAA